jgi:hypothetical protein
MKIPWFAFVLLASTLAGSRAQVAGTSAQATVNPTGTALPALCAQLNCETIFWEKWLTHLVFGFDGR